MCEIGGKLTTTYDDGSYLKGRIGHQGYYVPHKGGERMRKQALEYEGEVVNATTVKGMLVRIGGGYVTNTIKPVNGHQLIPRNNPVNNGSEPDSRSRSRNNQVDNQIGFWNRGGYKWVCRNCTVVIYATSEPRFCPKCKGG